MVKFYIILVISVAISAVGNILLKKSALKQYEKLIKEYLNPYVIIGYALIFLSSILTIISFKGMDYKNEQIIEPLGYIFILVLSNLFLGEKFTKKKIIGNAIILVGILVYYL